jgi:hypothetical protein
MYLDGYVKHNDKGSAAHPVKMDRGLLIFDGKAPIDVIADGEHKACGEKGQPYLIWSPTDRNYRIQTWGHLVENAKWRWYWDARVTLGGTVENDCLSPGKQTPTVKVQEAWWNNFKVPTGQWALGKGEMNNANGWPTGRSVVFGRTVWHGDGKIPYFMTGDATSRPTWCVKRIVANPNLSGT